MQNCSFVGPNTNPRPTDRARALPAIIARANGKGIRIQGSEVRKQFILTEGILKIRFYNNGCDVSEWCKRGSFLVSQSDLSSGKLEVIYLFILVTVWAEVICRYQTNFFCPGRQTWIVLEMVHPHGSSLDPDKKYGEHCNHQSTHCQHCTDRMDMSPALFWLDLSQNFSHFNRSMVAN